MVAGADVVVVEVPFAVVVVTLVVEVVRVVALEVVVLLEPPPPDEPKKYINISAGGFRHNGSSSLTSGSYRGCQVAAFDVNAGEVEVLIRVFIAVTGQLQHAQMPVSAVARSRYGNSRDRQLEVVGTRRVPEGNRVSVKVDLVGDVVPHAGGELLLPLHLAVGHPLEVGVFGAACAAKPADLHLGEVALEEVDLVLAGCGGRVGVAAHHAEVVPDLTRVDGGRGLRDQLGTSHRLAIPVGRVGESDLDALVRARVGGVLVIG